MLITSNEEDKVVKGAIAGAVEGVLSVNPITAISWSAIKGARQGYLNSRIKTFTQFIEQNFEISTFEDEQFLDGLAITYNHFVSQRVEFKRRQVLRIFLGFVHSMDKENFELERYHDLLNKLSYTHIIFMRDFQRHRGNWGTFEYTDGKLTRGRYEHEEICNYLSYLGIFNFDTDKALNMDVVNEWDDQYIKEVKTYYFSDFGMGFLENIYN